MRNHTVSSIRTTLTVVGIVFASFTALAAVAVAGVVVVGCTMLGVGRGPHPDVETRSLLVTEMTYDECTRTVSGTLEGTRNSNENQPVTVTITAAVPGDPAGECRATAKAREQMDKKTVAVRFELTDEQAKAFADPAARKTVTIRGDYRGQLILAETDWPTGEGKK